MFNRPQSMDELAMFDIAVVKLTIDGLFDERITQLKNELAAISEFEGARITLEEVKTIKLAVDQERDTIAKQLATHLAEDVKLREREKAYKAKASEIERKIKDLAHREAELADMTHLFKEQSAKMAANYEEREALLAAGNELLAQNNADLANRIAQFNEKLESLKH